MELSDFIKTAITEIVKGVEAARQDVRDTGTLVNPTVSTANLISGVDNSHTRLRAVQMVEMHIPVTVEDRAGSTAGIGIMKVISAGFKKSDESVSQTVSTIKFSIPISLPADSPEAVDQYLSTKNRNI